MNTLELNINRQNLLSFDQGLLDINNQEEETNTALTQTKNLPAKLDLFPSTELMDPYAGTALDLTENLSQKTLLLLQPKINNDQLFSTGFFEKTIGQAHESLVSLENMKENKNFQKALCVLVNEMALRELLSHCQSALIAV